jgi:hypothetical protein
MFSKTQNFKRYGNERTVLTIEQLYDIVRNNPQRNLIETLRSCNDDTKKKSLKGKVNCIMPHGVFTYTTNASLLRLSGYFYFDIDNLDTKVTLNDTIQRLKDTGYVCFIQTSTGGKGLSFLLKIESDFDITPDNFLEVYRCARQKLKSEGFHNIDNNASGLSRKMVISSDPDAFLETKNAFKLVKTDLDIFKEVKKVKTKQPKKQRDIEPNDTLSKDVIPFNELIKQIRVETLYTKEIDGDFVIEDMSYYKIIIPEVIKDGSKHKLYCRVVNALYYINPDINKNQVYSYLYHINTMAKPPMDEFSLMKLVSSICNSIEETGEIYIKPRIKRIHFQKDSKLTQKQKQSMGAQIAGKIKVNKSLALIEEAREQCYRENVPPTQRRIQEITGLSLRTIKRNWNKPPQVLEDITIPEDTTEDLILKEITLDEFLYGK